jgi:hypothetical protein
MNVTTLPRSGARQWRPGDGPVAMLAEGERVSDGMGVNTSGFMFQREVDRSFLDRLRQLSPESDDVSWLLPWWEPGDPWIPGQRWVLFQLVHPKLVDLDILDELEGPHPRSEGHICTSLPTHAWALPAPDNYQPCLCRKKIEGWRGGPCSLITRTQWEIFRKTERFAEPFWIVQGTTGGHQWEFSEQESRLLRQHGLPDETPRLGRLPYAPLDERVLGQIMKHNKLITMEMEISEFKRTMGEGFQRYKNAIAQQQRANWLDYLKTQLADVSELARRVAKTEEYKDLPKTSIDYVRLDEQNDEHWVNTGRILTPREMK